MPDLQEKFQSHEIDCEKRYGELRTRIGKIDTDMMWLKRAGLFIIGSILTFELNAIFKVIGH